MRFLKIMLVGVAIVFTAVSISHAHEKENNNNTNAHDDTEVPSLEGTNKDFVNSFCAYHPTSPICITKPNPPARLPFIPPGIPGDAGPGPTIPPYTPTGCTSTPAPPITGNVFRLTGKTVNQPLPRLQNYDTVVIENNRFVGGRCTAITVNPCTVKNIIIRNNTFENWSGSGCDLGMVVYVGWQASHTNCQPNALLENNRFVGTDTFKRAFETKTSNVIIRGNVADSRLEVRHGRNLLIECNNFKGYEIFGDNHVLRNNAGGTINLGDGQITQEQVAPHSGYPVARNITLQGNKSPVKTFCWQHSAGGCKYKATYNVIK